GTFAGGTNGTALVVTFAGANATPAAAQALVRAISYRNTSDNPSALTRTVRFTLTDGDGGTSNQPPPPVAGPPLDDAPVVTAAPTAPFTEKGPPTALDAAATVTDADSANFNGGSLTVDYAANGTADDLLSIVNQGTGAGQIGVAGSNLTFANLPIGSF